MDSNSYTWDVGDGTVISGGRAGATITIDAEQIADLVLQEQQAEQDRGPCPHCGQPRPPEGRCICEEQPPDDDPLAFLDEMDRREW